MQVKTTSGSGAGALGIIGTGLALALPNAKWIGWTLVVIGFFVFVFDIHLERGQLTSVGSAATLKQRFKRMWPQYLMVVCGIGFFVGLVAFLQLNVNPSPISSKEELAPKPGPLSGLTRPMLRERTITFAAQLRHFETEAKIRAPAFPIRPLSNIPADRVKELEEWQKKNVEYNAEFAEEWRSRYRLEAIELDNELRERLDHLPPPKMGEAGFNGIFTRNLAGPTPVMDVADYLEGLARRL